MNRVFFLSIQKYLRPAKVQNLGIWLYLIKQIENYSLLI